MKKKFLIGIGFFFTLLLLAAVLSPLFIDINHFRPVIEKKLEEKFNANVTLGHLKLSIIKGIGAEIEGITILNPPGYSKTPLLEASRVKIHLGTLKSLFGNPTAKITVIKPKIRIEKNETNLLNIQSLLKPKKEAPSSQPMPKAIMLPAGIVGSLVMRGGLFLYLEEGEIHDQSGKEIRSIKNLSLKTNALSLKNPIECDISGILEGGRYFPEGTPAGEFKLKTNISNPIKVISLKSLELLEKISFDAELLFQLGQLNLKANVSNFSTFQGELKLLLKTEKGEKEGGGYFPEGTSAPLPVPEGKISPPFFDADLSLSMTMSGALKPAFIQQAQGEMEIRKLAGKIPAFLTPLLAKQNVTVEGNATLRGKSRFQIKNNKPTKVEFENIEVDLTPTLLNYKTWSKPKSEILVLKLSGLLEEIENRRQLTLSPSSIQFVKMVLNATGKVSIAETVFLDLSISSNTFPAETFKRYLPALPFDFKGPVEISRLSVLGNPQKIENLNIQGKISAPQGRLEFNPAYFKEKKWGAEGPIRFSMLADFALQGKKLTSLKLNTDANFSDATLRLENRFYKPAQKNLTFAFSSSLDRDLMKFEKLNLEFHNMKLQAEGSLTHFSVKPKRYLSLLLSTDPFGLSEWNQFFPSIQKPFEGTAEIKNLKLDIPLNSPRDLSIRGKIALNQVSGEIPEKLIQGKNVELEGPFFMNLATEIDIQKKEIKKLNLSGNMNFTNMSMRFKDHFLKPKQVPFEMTFNAQSSADKLTIEKTTFKLKDLLIGIEGKIASLTQKPDYTLDLETSSFSLDDLGQFIPAVKNRHLLGNLRFKAQFKGSPTTDKSPLYLSFQLNSSEISYAPPISEPRKAEEENKEISTPSKTPSQKPTNPILDRLQANGQLRITKALFKNYRLWDLSASLSLKDKILEVVPLKFQFYDGKFSSHIKMDLRQPEPKTEISASLQKLNVDKFLTAQKSKAAGKFSGSLDTTLNLSMRGKNADRIKSSLTGNGEIIVRDGMFKIFNLSEALEGLPIIPQVAPHFKLSDEFDLFKTSVLIKNQRVENPDMILQGKNHLIHCRGFLYFDGSLDYKGSYFLSQKEDYRKEIPFVVTGTVSNPKPVPDVGKLLQNTVQGVFEKILTPKTDKTPPPSEPKKPESETTPLEEILKEVPF